LAIAVILVIDSETATLVIIIALETA